MSKRAEFYIKGRELLATPYHYTASGLDNVYLLNGVSVSDTAYGQMVSIEHMNGLHLAIGLHIIERSDKLSGQEFRFLRKQMGATQRDIARAMRVSDQTIANYEKGVTTELGAADPFMRLHYLLHILPEDTRVELLKHLDNRPPRVPDLPRRKLVQKWQEPQALAAA